MTSDRPPLLGSKRYDEPSRFQVENLLREARRQRNLPDALVPDVCLLDPDGDVVRHLRATDRLAHENHLFTDLNAAVADARVHAGRAPRA